MFHFIDRAVVHTTGGNGGDGCSSMHREKFKPLGGPDGGNGGHGGSIFFISDANTRTLLDLHFHSHIIAPSGKSGLGNKRNGATGSDLFIRVPNGTIVLDKNDRIVSDLTGVGKKFKAALGGCGGLGNASLISKSCKAPNFALLGAKGTTNHFILEFKVVADVGLLGFPSAGKSSIVSTISSAKPKVAEYPFTTKSPTLGIVSVEKNTFTIADIPGLIPGASKGHGLGLDFLKHLERCIVLVHVVDCATQDPGRDPVSDIELLEEELFAYTSRLKKNSNLNNVIKHPRIIALNKVDIPYSKKLAKIVKNNVFNKFGWPVHKISSVSHFGLNNLTFALNKVISSYKENKINLFSKRPVIYLSSFNEKKILFDKCGDDNYRIYGVHIEHLVKQINFNNKEAMIYFNNYLTQLGIENMLLDIGAKLGCNVLIGNVCFKWKSDSLAYIKVLNTSKFSFIN